MFNHANIPAASEYFGISRDELAKDAGNGYKRGDNVILDHTLINCPFCGTLERALESVEWYNEHGYYAELEIVATDYTDEYQFAILAR